MITLVIGGSGSGKSAYAEDLLSEYDKNKYYLATMIVNDQEAQKRVDRHRELRKDKGFETIECSRNIDTVAVSLPEDGSAVVLLECMSNLVANEMFEHSQAKSAEEVTAKLLKDIQYLASKVSQLVLL